MEQPPKITLDTSFVNPNEKPKELPRLVESKDWTAEAKSTLQAHQDPEFTSRRPQGSQAYEYTPSQLNALVDPKNAFVLREIGGPAGLKQALDTNLSSGLTDSQAEDPTRLDLYSRNVLPERKTKSLLQLMWIALQDKVLIILSVAAVVSLGLGIYETVGTPAQYDSQGRKEPKVEWVEGVAILVAVFIVVIVGSVNDWQKERQFAKLNKKKEDRKVNALRNGIPTEVSVYDIVVGDILMVEPGDMIPADGVVIRSDDIRCDESSASGESDTMTKHPAKITMDKLNGDSNGVLDPHSKSLDSFMLSGAKVLEGTGTYVITAVGPNSLHGRTMMSLQDEAEATPLQEKLNNIAEGIAKFGFAAALVLFTALMIRFLVQLKGSTMTPAGKATQFMNLFITAVTIVVVAVPEGLPLAVTLALAFATTRMVKDNNLVRVLKSCETMGGATTICSDKTGTLTQNRMSVVAATVGVSATCRVKIDEDPEATEKTDAGGEATPSALVSSLPAGLSNILLESLGINSTAFEANEVNAPEPFIGSKTETALLIFARDYLNMDSLVGYRQSREVAKVFPFDSARKFMATVIRTETGYRLLLKGASEVVLARCSSIVDNSNLDAVRDMTPEDVGAITAQIESYASRSLRTIGVVYRDLPSTWSPEEVDPATLFSNMTFIAVFGIQDPLRPGVRQAVADCRTAGVVVRMVTGDNINTARAIAIDCGILSPNAVEGEEIVMEGPVFRKLDPFRMREVVPKLRVLARSSPEDKRRLVKYLKSENETVAVTGDGTNDAPALKLADIGFSMGIAGTEVAKEASDVILMDDNFGSIVKAIKWGRTVNDSVKKFLQFQLTVNITAVLLTFVSAVANSSDQSVLTAVQLLWVNLIMDTLAALALATDPPADSVLLRKPDGRKASLISPTMWKLILGQAVLQLIITFVLHFAGSKIFGMDPNDGVQNEQLASMVFNTFVWLQFFNMIVNRRLDNRQNVFEGITKNYYFLAIMFIIGGMQIVIMYVGGAAFSIHRQTGPMWGVAVICGVLSLPCGVLLRMIPDAWVIKLYPERLVNFVLGLIPRRKSASKGDEESLADSNQDFVWNSALERVRQELVFLKTVRGGRLRQLKFKPKNVYETWKMSRSPSTASISNAGSSPTSTLVSGAPYHATTLETENGYLAVPNTRPTRSRGSSGSSLAALALVPAVVGGAVGGWGPEVRKENASEQTS